MDSKPSAAPKNYMNGSSKLIDPSILAMLDEATEVAAKEVEDPQGTSDAVIVVEHTNELETIRKAVHRLSSDNALYVFGGHIYIADDKTPPTFTLMRREAQACRVLLSRGIQWKERSAKKGAHGYTLVPTKPPTELSVAVYDALVLAHPQQLRSIKPLYEHRVLRDGRFTESKNQFVQELGCWTALEGQTQPLPEPQRVGEFREAIKETLRELFRFNNTITDEETGEETDDAEENDLRGAMALMSTLALLPILRGPTMPVWIVGAAQPGCGKTTLVEFVHRCTRTPYKFDQYTNDQEELKKKVATACAEYAPAMFFDNAKHFINSPILEATATSWDQPLGLRLLGRNESVQQPCRFVTIFTMNGAEVTPDMARRVLEVNLVHPNGGSPLPVRKAREHINSIEEYSRAISECVLDIVSEVYRRVPEGTLITWDVAYEMFWNEEAPNTGPRMLKTKDESIGGAEDGLVAIVKAWPEKAGFCIRDLYFGENEPRPKDAGAVTPELEAAVRVFVEDVIRMQGGGKSFTTEQLRRKLGMYFYHAAKRRFSVDGRRLESLGKRSGSTGGGRVFRVKGSGEK